MLPLTRPIQNGIFEYTFIPLSENMQETSITRQINPTNPLTLADIQSFVYPFTDLPKLESHVHPKFAIYELGRKLAPIFKHDPARYDALFTLWPSLHQVLDIYNAWSRPIPADRPPSFKSISSSSDEGKDKDGDFDNSKTNRTDHHRIRPDRNLRKRQRSEHGDNDGDGSPKPSGARQAGLGSSLSHETLVEHEHLVGESGWTRENFLKWVESVREEPAPEVIEEV
ncbi:hypothetical protein ONZ45_g18735 [Pleurotus djamor]|nr:hypothetical protein ONZ45_g18735 [Pleurotus djamor]